MKLAAVVFSPLRWRANLRVSGPFYKAWYLTQRCGICEGTGQNFSEIACERPTCDSIWMTTRLFMLLGNLLIALPFFVVLEGGRITITTVPADRCQKGIEHKQGKI